MPDVPVTPLPRPGPTSVPLLDAAGTRSHPREPIAATYADLARLARRWGCQRSEAEIGATFDWAMDQA